MSKDYNKKKSEQLGQPHGTASAKLRKQILFYLVGLCGLDICFQCKLKIVTVDDFSIEHKEPWLDSENPIDKFFDLDNIAFSHLRCNVGASRRPNKKYFSREEFLAAHRIRTAAYERRTYTIEKRRARYKRTGK